MSLYWFPKLTVVDSNVCHRLVHAVANEIWTPEAVVHCLCGTSSLRSTTKPPFMILSNCSATFFNTREAVKVEAGRIVQAFINLLLEEAHKVWLQHKAYCL
eukprot:m.86422 g.86422  ORF g.86422 m.86422 type:complete len:101 (-) comp13057_c0_seq1:2888-3190(-)